MLFASIYNGLSAGLAIVFMGNSVKVLTQERRLDGQFIHFALVALIPLLFAVSLFTFPACTATYFIYWALLLPAACPRGVCVSPRIACRTECL
ncbi:hypothetical protein EDC04DRAFT_2762760 [Pisolithus marmoratus]|nr:hypothetical protein EDC04DRAFT_2762760 [Pisolithus marmoratus]